MSRTSFRTKLAAVAATGVMALGTGVLAASPAQAAWCGVSGGTLYCGNTPNIDMYRWAGFGAPYADTLKTNPSQFDCWTTGDWHGGGNNTWYGARGDVRGAFGFVPAQYVNTSSAFDAHPDWYGLDHC
ncbi:hypothetical protein OG444_20390 [Streptomyces sp. NBC_01232]|uniref:hypothetical protein n=1 Tax=unclassified Streptomyces TaxID=2593676 RepID=UPI002E11504F|nr:hypothetical protein OG444_20390 [Streptomyces sp. NBC_01232]